MVVIHALISLMIVALHIEDSEAALTLTIRKQTPSSLVALINPVGYALNGVSKSCLSSGLISCGYAYNDAVQIVESNTYCLRGSDCQHSYNFNALYDGDLRINLKQNFAGSHLTVEFKCTQAGQGLYINKTYQSSGMRTWILSPNSIVPHEGWHYQWYGNDLGWLYSWVTVAQCQTLPTTIPTTTTTQQTTQRTTSTTTTTTTEYTLRGSIITGENNSSLVVGTNEGSLNNNRIVIIVVPTLLVVLLLITAAFIIIIIILKRRKQKHVTAIFNKFINRNRRRAETTPNPVQSLDRHTYGCVGDNNTYNRLGERIIVDRSSYYATGLDNTDGVSTRPATSNDDDTVSYHCVYDLQEQTIPNTDNNYKNDGYVTVNGDVYTEVNKGKLDQLYENFPAHQTETTHDTRESEDIILYDNDLYENSDIS